MSSAKRLRLGEILTRAGVITDDQLQVALAKQQLTREPIGEILVGLGFVTSGQIGSALELQYGARSVSLSSSLNLDFARLLPVSEIRKLRAVPVGIGQVSVAVVDPSSLSTLEELKARFKGASVQPVVVTEREFAELMAKLGSDESPASGVEPVGPIERTTPQAGPAVFRLPIADETDLRLLEPRHAQAVFALVDPSRLSLREWLPWVDATRSPADILAFIRGALRDFADGSAVHCGIWHRDRVVGVVGLKAIHPATGSAQIGYWLGHAYEGKGFMTRACRALISHAFGELGLSRIEIRCATPNRRSRAIPERLGFVEEGTLRGQERIGDRLEDHVVYGLLRSEWEAAELLQLGT